MSYGTIHIVLKLLLAKTALTKLIEYILKIKFQILVQNWLIYIKININNDNL